MLGLLLLLLGPAPGPALAALPAAPAAPGRSEKPVWRAVLGDLCQLPSLPRATGDPARYLECVRQDLSADR